MLGVAQQFSTQFQLKESENFGLNPLDASFEHKAFPIVSSDKQNVLLLLSTSGILRAELLNNRLRPQQSLSANIPEVKELNVLMGGFQLDSMNYVAVFSNKKRNSFSAFQVQLDQDSISATDFSLRFKGERLLHTFTTSEGYYIVTVQNRSSIIKIYKLFRSLRGTLSLSRYAYDFSDEEEDRTLPNLHKELMEFTERGNQRLVKIGDQTKVKLAVAGSYFKLYQTEEKLTLTLDHIHGRTSIYEMYLNSNIKNFQLINYPSYVANNLYQYNANSILIGDTLVQMAISKEDLEITFHDLPSEEVVREINLSRAVMDTAAIGHFFKGEEMKGRKSSRKMKKLLREIVKGQAAFALFYDDKRENLAIETGSYQNGYNGPLTDIGQTQDALDYVQAETRQRSMFSLVVDPEGIPIQGYHERTDPPIPIEDFKKENKIRNPIIETIFRLNNQHFYCWHNLQTNRIVIRKIRRVATGP